MAIDWEARATRAEAERDALRAEIQWFCDRVEAGEVRSVRTYARFKEALSATEGLSDMVLVPREPTDAMLAATCDERGTSRVLEFTKPEERSKPFLMARYIYRAMIAYAGANHD